MAATLPAYGPAPGDSAHSDWLRTQVGRLLGIDAGTERLAQTQTDEEDADGANGG